MSDSVTLFYSKQYDNRWPPERLTEFAIWLDNLIKEIPKDVLSTATIDISTTGYDSNTFPTISVMYLKKP